MQGVELYKTSTDEELVVHIASGNNSAFSELYSRYGQKMFSYFFRMLWKNKELAEDFTQDLFIKLVKDPGSFQQGRPFPTWLYSVAHNMCKNEYRKNEVRIKHTEMEKQQPIVASANNPDLKRFKEALHNCTQELNEEKRWLYILRFQENLSVPEISQVMNIAEGTVKSRIFYLLKEMKNKLKEFETLHIYP